MKDLEKLKKDIHENPEIKKYFFNIRDGKKAAEVAKNLGYEVSETEIMGDEELNEDMLEAVAGGGKGDTTIDKRDIVYVDPSKNITEIVTNEKGQVIDYVKGENK